MDVFTAIQKRRSVRRFQKKIIPKKFEEKLIDALIWAPSAGNLQSRKFFFIKNMTIKERVVEAALYQEFVLDAPLVVVACSDSRIQNYYGKRGESLYAICNVATSLQNFMLQATELGLGTCWIGAFDEEKMKETLKIPNHLKPIAVIPVGFPAENPEVPLRPDKKKLVENR